MGLSKHSFYSFILSTQINHYSVKYTMIFLWFASTFYFYFIYLFLMKLTSVLFEDMVHMSFVYGAIWNQHYIYIHNAVNFHQSPPSILSCAFVVVSSSPPSSCWQRSTTATKWSAASVMLVSTQGLNFYKRLHADNAGYQISLVAFCGVVVVVMGPRFYFLEIIVLLGS